MKCKISCSFGEIIDKITILKIKFTKANDIDVLNNIKLEFDTIINEVPESNYEDPLFDELLNINQKLWVLEDLIRDKSAKKSFDEKYIEYAEKIHITNDERYQIKRKINEKYNSELKEEKIYKKDLIEFTPDDIIDLNLGKKLYNEGKFNQSLEILSKLYHKFKNYKKFNDLYIDLLYAYHNINTIFGYSKVNFDYIRINLNKLNISNELKEYCKKSFVHLYLRSKEYKIAFDYIHTANYITGPNVSCDNMDFFKKDDVNKILFIYDAGGIGDKFMYSRFIPQLCETYFNNKIVLFINDNVSWFFNFIFKKFDNFSIIPYSRKDLIPNFDYHCSLISLLKYLDITYDKLYFNPLFLDLPENINERNKDIIHKLKSKSNSKKTYIINWRGNIKNPQEKFNRGMHVIYTEPLFQLENIDWLVISKDISDEEEFFLKQHNVQYIGDKIDNTENCFEDSIDIIRNVNGVISTDTSLVHLSCNLGIKTYALLTTGCEWRWTLDDKTNWYPDCNLIRQNKQGNWKDVIVKLKEKLVVEDHLQK